MEKVSQNTITYSDKIQEIINNFNQQIDSRSTGQTKIGSIYRYNRAYATDVTTKITNIRSTIISNSATYGTCNTVRSTPSGYSSVTISQNDCLDDVKINSIINDVNLLLNQCGCNSYASSPSNACNNCAHCGNCTCQSTCCNTVACNNAYACSTNKSCKDCCQYDTSGCCDGDCSYSPGSGGCSDTCSSNSTSCSSHACLSYLGGCLHGCGGNCSCNGHSSCSCDTNSCCDSDCNTCCNTYTYCCNTVACNPHGTTSASRGCTAQCSCNQNACSCNANCSCNKVCSCNWV